MHETADKLSMLVEQEAIQAVVMETANMAPVKTLDTSTLRFASISSSSEVPVLLTIKLKENCIRLVVNSEKVVINTVLLKAVKTAIASCSDQ